MRSGGDLELDFVGFSLFVYEYNLEANMWLWFYVESIL